MLLQRRMFPLAYNDFGEGGVVRWSVSSLIGVRLPVKWVDKSILVAEQALINPPYTVESVVSVTSVLNGGTEDNGKSALLTRVKHVVGSQHPQSPSICAFFFLVRFLIP